MDIELDEPDEKDWKDYIEFLKEVVNNSAHTCDNATWVWHKAMMKNLEKLVEKKLKHE